MANKKLTELTAVSTVAKTDLVYVVTEPGGTAVSHKITVANLAINICQSGSYTGDGAANKAIPHGLIDTPAIVSIQTKNTTARAFFSILKSSTFLNAIYQPSTLPSDNVSKFFPVTTPDATNFYVGNTAAGSTDYSGNKTGIVYKWVAQL